MLSKLKAHGIPGHVLFWIGEWLNKKQQSCFIGCVSDWSYHVISGVPQRAILGPVLFLIFINDIDKGVINKLLKFADDTKLIGVVSNETEIEQLRSDLQTLYNCSVDRQMMFNTDKCKSLHFGNKNVKSLSIYLSKKSRLGRRKCRDTTRAPNNVN